MERTNDGRPLMVTIQCFAYNQELYIRQCLDGFVMQKTDFPFVAIVHDGNEYFYRAFPLIIR